MDSDRAFTFEKGSGLYQVRFNYTGKNWTHADVAGIRIHTEKPIAVLPMQYTTHLPCNREQWLTAGTLEKNGTPSPNVRSQADLRRVDFLC